MIRRSPSLSALLALAAGLLTLPGRDVRGAGPLEVFHPNSMPARIARTADGRLLVSDPAQNAVFIYGADLSLLGELKMLSSPLGVASDGDGNIYVGNDGRDNIEVYDREGNLVSSMGEGILRKPNDLAMDLDGNLYVADSEQDRITVFDAGGTLLRHIGVTGTGAGQFKFPVAIDIAYPADAGGLATGELVVADQGNARVQVLGLGGNFLRAFGGKIPDFGTNWTNKFNSIQSVAVDDLCRTHALDAYMNHVQVFSPAPESNVFTYGLFGLDPGQLNLPLDIVITDQARGVVANSGNARVEVIHADVAATVLLSANAVPESAPPGTVVGTLSVDPVPPEPPVFVLVTPHGRARSAFVIDGNVLKTAAPLDHEAFPGGWQIKVKAVSSQSRNLALGTPLTIQVGDENDAPTAVSLSGDTVFENQPAGTLVGRLLAQDPDAADTNFVYALVSGPGDQDNALFSISGDEVFTTQPLDHEAATNLSICVRAEDAQGAAVTGAVSVAVIDIGEVTDPDSDHDGMPDWFERDICGSPTALDPDADQDGDGVTNLEEWTAATDPRFARSVLALNAMPAAGAPEGVLMYWETAQEAERRVYDIEYCTNLMSRVWIPLVSGLPPTPDMNVFTNQVHGAESRVYYRIKARIAP